MNDETPKSRDAFMRYLALGPDRSLAKLNQVLGNPPSYIRNLERWSSLHNWQERAEKHDIEELAKEAEALAKQRADEIEAMHRRHALIGTTQQARAIEILNKLAAAEELDANIAVRLLKLGVDIERAARGEDAQKVQLSGKDGGPVIITTEWGTFKPVEDDEKE